MPKIKLGGIVMTIYDVKFYGVCYPKLIGDFRLMLYQSMEGDYQKAPQHFRFEVTLLKSFYGKKDVLQLQWVGRNVEYLTLQEPSMCFEDGMWHPCESSKVTKAFLEEYEKMHSQKKADKHASLFELTFYGRIRDWEGGNPNVTISLSNASELGRIVLIAEVLKEFKGNKYVVKLETNGNVDYIPLFNEKMYYDIETDMWLEGMKSLIPIQILECYIKYLNE